MLTQLCWYRPVDSDFLGPPRFGFKLVKLQHAWLTAVMEARASKLEQAPAHLVALTDSANTMYRKLIRLCENELKTSSSYKPFYHIWQLLECQTTPVSSQNFPSSMLLDVPACSCKMQRRESC